MAKEDILVVEAMTMWCDPHRVNQLSGKVQCDLVRLSKDTVKLLKAKGLNVNFDTKNSDDSEDFKGFWVRAKAETAVPVKDMSGKELPPNLLIGNGSIVKAAIEPREWFHKDSGRSGVKARWLGLRIKEYVPYDPDGAARKSADSVLDEASGGEGGFVFGETSQDFDDTESGDAGTETNTGEQQSDDFDALFDDDAKTA